MVTRKIATSTPDHIEPMLNEIAAVKANPDIAGLETKPPKWEQYDAYPVKTEAVANL